MDTSTATERAPEARPKPVVILVHGGWHRPIHYLNVIEGLRELGYTVEAPALPTTGPCGLSDEELCKVTLDDDVRAVRETMEPYLEQGLEVVMLAHSYGGIVITSTMHGFTLRDRAAQGLAGGVKTAVYMAALAPLGPGFDTLEVAGAPLPDWCKHDEDRPISSLGRGAFKALYQDIDAPLASMAFNSCAKQSMASLNLHSAPIATCDITAPIVYIVTRDDGVIPEHGQRAMAEAACAKIEVLPCGHSPFLRRDMSARVVNIVHAAAQAS